MRTTLENNDIYDPIIRRGRKYGFADIIPATAFQIDASMPPLLFMTPAGAVNVRLPLATAAMKGLRFTIVNLSAFVITLQTSAGGAFTNAMVCGVFRCGNRRGDAQSGARLGNALSIHWSNRCDEPEDPGAECDRRIRWQFDYGNDTSVDIRAGCGVGYDYAEWRRDGRCIGRKLERG
jgi:hypothetical protein